MAPSNVLNNLNQVEWCNGNIYTRGTYDYQNFFTRTSLNLGMTK